ncbi:MAG: thioredoxin family protein [Bacilli bacterium]|nr:thioredoxin family protein [Bacilli bacterium]
MHKFSYKTIIFFFIIFLFFPSLTNAEEPLYDVDIHFFWGNGCPHCAKAEKVLEKIEKKYNNITIYDYQVYSNATNQKIFEEMTEAIGENIEYIPCIIIGTRAIVGFHPTLTKTKVIDAIEYYSYNENDGPILEDEKEVDVPIFGKIDPTNFSLPLITIVLGTLDGFNPCAMWVLLFLISVLIGLKDRKKMWVLGFTFLFTSALIYFLFMAAWLEFMLILEMLVWLRLLIGLVALIGGGINLKSYFNSNESGCKVVDEEKRTKIFNKINKLTKENKMHLAIIGIITLAISVNMIELICSAGLPVIYTKILAMNELNKIVYYGYLLLYVLFFLLDDLIIFSIAMLTLKLTGISTKYSRYSSLIGGILMIIIGILLIIKPEWLMFG